MAPRSHPAFLLLLLALAGCLTPSTPPAGDDDAAGDDDDGAPPVPVTATVGPEGGAVVLADGSGVLVPPGALTEDVTLTITPQDRFGTPWDDTTLPLGTPFSLVPTVMAVAGTPFVYRVPLGTLPAGVTAADTLLAVESERIADTPEGNVLERGVGAWAPGPEDGGFATFTNHAIAAGASFEGVVAAEAPSVPSLPPPAGVAPLPLPSGLLWGCPCSGYVAGEFGQAAVPPDLDSTVSLAPTLLRNQAWVDWLVRMTNNGQPYAAVGATDRFHARLCLSAYRAIVYYEAMGTPLAPRPIPISGTWNGTTSSPTALGSANGLGIEIAFLGPADDTPAFQGYSRTPHPPDGWNDELPGAGPAFVDLLDTVVAHEVAHYVQFHATLNPTARPAPWRLFIEGGAEALSEEVFDAPPSRVDYPLSAEGLPADWPQVADSTPRGLFGENRNAYDASVYWRFLDWSQEVPDRTSHPIVRLLRKVRANSTIAVPYALQLSDLDQLAQDLHPSRPGHDLDATLRDFARAWLLEHSFERAPPGGPEADADRYPDAVGARLDELGEGRMWRRVGEASPVEPDQPYLRGGGVPVVDAGANTPFTLSAQIPSHGASAAWIDMSFLQPSASERPVALTFTATSAFAPSTDVSIQLFFVRPGQPIVALFEADSLSTVPAAPTKAIIPASIGSAATGANGIVVLAANHGPNPADLEIDAATVASRLLAVGRDVGGVDVLRLYDVVDATPVPRALGTTGADSASTGLGYRGAAVCNTGTLRAFVTLSDADVAVYDLTPGSEGEIDVDGDPSNGPTRIALTPFGLSEPRGVACAYGLPRAFVAAREGIAVLDTVQLTVEAAVPWSSIGIADSARPYRLATARDDARLYATLWNQATMAETRTVALSIPGMLDPPPFPNLVEAEFVRPGDATTGRHLSVSTNGRLLATTVPVAGWLVLTNTLLDADLDPGGPGLPLYYQGDPSWTSPPGPNSSAWAPDEEVVYLGHPGGPPGSTLGATGVVRRCAASDTYCDHVVGVACPVRSVAVTGSATDHVVWALDACGYLTGLPDELFVADPATSGWSPGCADEDELDGTGGCLDTSCLAKPSAISCTDTLQTWHLGMPGVEVVAY